MAHVVTWLNLLAGAIGGLFLLAVTALGGMVWLAGARPARRPRR